MTMNNKAHIDQLIEEALSSVDDVSRAEPKPYLLTRINARLSRQTETAWERAGRFIARPVVVIAGLFIIIAVNVSVAAFNNNSNTSVAANDQATVTTDEFSTTVARLYENDNIEP